MKYKLILKEGISQNSTIQKKDQMMELDMEIIFPQMQDNYKNVADKL